MKRLKYGKLKTAHKKRLKQRANLRYRRKHPSHRMKYGHNFVADKACGGKVCLKCRERDKMMPKFKKHRLLILAKRMARTAREHEQAVRDHDELLREMGFELAHEAGGGVGEVHYLPDWYVEKTEYGKGEITEENIEQLLSQLKKLESGGKS